MMYKTECAIANTVPSELYPNKGYLVSRIIISICGDFTEFIDMKWPGACF